MYNGIKNLKLALAILASLALFGLVSHAPLAQETSKSDSSQDKVRPRRTNETQQPRPSASPSPTPKEEVPQDSDEVVRVETNLTTIFFTAADKNKRFINTLKQDDIRVLEDDQPQQIFSFQQNIDLPLSTAILIDTSASEERTLPDEKAAARTFL